MGLGDNTDVVEMLEGTGQKKLLMLTGSLGFGLLGVTSKHFLWPFLRKK